MLVAWLALSLAGACSADEIGGGGGGAGDPDGPDGGLADVESVAPDWAWGPADPGTIETLRSGVKYEVRTWNGFAVRAIRADLRDAHVHIRTSTGAEREETVARWCDSMRDCLAAVDGDFVDLTSSPRVPNGLALGEYRVWSPDGHENFIAATATGADGAQLITQHVYLPGDPDMPAAGPFTTDALGAIPPRFKWGYGGRPTLLEDGRVIAPNPGAADDRFAHASKVWCDNQGILCSPFRRTATGYQVDAGGRSRFFYLVVTDSRMTLHQTALLMRAMGATAAIGHDSDTSTVMWIRGKGVVNNAISTPHPQVNNVGIAYY
jgi:hypothetical protein